MTLNISEKILLLKQYFENIYFWWCIPLIYNICIDMIRSKIKDNLRTFEPDNQEILRTSQPEKIFTGPYIKKRVYYFPKLLPLSKVPSFIFSCILKGCASLCCSMTWKQIKVRFRWLLRWINHKKSFWLSILQFKFQPILWKL